MTQSQPIFQIRTFSNSNNEFIYLLRPTQQKESDVPQKYLDLIDEIGEDR